MTYQLWVWEGFWWFNFCSELSREEEMWKRWCCRQVDIYSVLLLLIQNKTTSWKLKLELRKQRWLLLHCSLQKSPHQRHFFTSMSFLRSLRRWSLLCPLPGYRRKQPTWSITCPQVTMFSWDLPPVWCDVLVMLLWKRTRRITGSHFHGYRGDSGMFYIYLCE